MNGPADEASLKLALRDILNRPYLLLTEWNWKAAAFSAGVRGTLFFLTNRHTGSAHAAKAMAVEAAYATVTAGLAGAVTQRLRHARPRLYTALFVLLAIPMVMLAAQAAVHCLAGTPRIRTGLALSFLFASMASGFNWFAMSQGVFVTGGTRSLWQDLSMLPKLTRGAINAVVRLCARPAGLRIRLRDR